MLLAGFVVIGYAQPAGTEYVMQPDFGDATDTIYPQATGEWIHTPWWKDVQPLGTQTDWFGPHYQPLGASSHLKYVMIDDDPFDYGAIAGNLNALEYRLVACDFDFQVYDPSPNNSFVDGGTLYVLLTNSDLDVRGFNADDPAAFEAAGLGQVLFTFDIPGGIEGAPTDPWSRFSALNPNTSAYRTAYALGKSTTGTPGSPFTYVGLVWRSRDPFAERILIDNFSLRDVCPDCVFLPLQILDHGCFDNTWISPIPNNYYYFTAEIVDSTTGDLVYNVVHQPATFSWNGIGNIGVWNGVQVPFGLPLAAKITYYSCLRSQANVHTVDYRAVRQAGCIDFAFGGNKAGPAQRRLLVAPSIVQSDGPISVRFVGGDCSEANLRLWSGEGKEVLQVAANPAIQSSNGQQVILPPLHAGVYFLEIVGRNLFETAKICILD